MECTAVQGCSRLYLTLWMCSAMMQLSCSTDISQSGMWIEPNSCPIQFPIRTFPAACTLTCNTCANLGVVKHLLYDECARITTCLPPTPFSTKRPPHQSCPRSGASVLTCKDCVHSSVVQQLLNSQPEALCLLGTHDSWAHAALAQQQSTSSRLVLAPQLPSP